MTDDQAHLCRERIAEWSRGHPRPYPWRRTTDPFAILIAEVMLRRTRANQVAPIFERFIARFPAPADLAAAQDEEVAEIVWSLGLVWRVPAFKQLATVLVHTHGGTVPADHDTLLALPGVGDYVAAAVRAFAFDLPTTLADTNTVRVAARIFGLTYHAESRRNPAMRAQVDRLLDPLRPRDSARALLDFAAAVCGAQLPHCTSCPVSAWCIYGQLQLTSSQKGSA